MPADATPDSLDRRLAQAALPTLDDLAGDGWLVDDDDELPGAAGDGSSGSALQDCLPPAFPDHRRVADAEIAFVLPGTGLVVALASVFAGVDDAGVAWHALADEDFTRGFAEAIAAEVAGDDDDASAQPVELLGPIVSPSTWTIERRGVRTVQQRAVFAGATDRSVTPVVLHGAVIVVGRTVVLVWAVDGGSVDDDLTWRQLVERIEGRLDIARRLDA